MDEIKLGQLGAGQFSSSAVNTALHTPLTAVSCKKRSCRRGTEFFCKFACSFVQIKIFLVMSFMTCVKIACSHLTIEFFCAASYQTMEWAEVMSVFPGKNTLCKLERTLRIHPDKTQLYLHKLHMFHFLRHLIERNS